MSAERTGMDWSERIEDVCSRATRIAMAQGFCKITMGEKQVGVMWLSPRGQMRSWWEPIGDDVL